MSKGPRVELIVTHPPDPAAEALEEMGGRARNARPVMQKIMGHLTQAQREQFASEGARGGTPWPEKKDATKARQRRAGKPGDRSEHFTGGLEDSLTRATGGRGAIRRTSKQAATFGTKLFYGGFQDAQLIAPTKTDKDWMAEAIAGWLLHGDQA